MHAHDFEPGFAASPHLSVSREVDQADPEMLQAAVVGRSDAMSPGALLNLQREVIGSGGGSPLEGSTRTYMESRLGHDFSDVRVHTGPKADESARSINAQAYTVGTNVVFQTGKFAPETPTGLHTLAHELTHVVQQKSGPVAGSPAPGGIRLSDPSDSFERAAERSAATALAPTPQTAAAASGQGSVQRASMVEEQEDEAVQPLLAQRASMVEETEKEEE